MKEDDITKAFLSDLAYALKQGGSWIPKNHLVLTCRPLWDKWVVENRRFKECRFEPTSQAFEYIAMNDSKMTIQGPKESDWKCYLFGGRPGYGLTFVPEEGHVPNWFVRLMMRVCFNCRWEKKSGCEAR